MIKVASLDLGKDLSLYSKFLKQKGVDHRIVEEAGSQSVYISNLSDFNEVKASLELYLANRLNFTESCTRVKPIRGIRKFATLVNLVLRTPVTSFLIMASLSVAI